MGSVKLRLLPPLSVCRPGSEERVDGFGKRSKVQMGCCCETAAVAYVEASTGFPVLLSGEYS